MSQTLPEIDVLFVAGFGPISRDTASSTAFYVQTLGLPLKPMEGMPIICSLKRASWKA
jgi:hypothetical protein